LKDMVRKCDKMNDESFVGSNPPRTKVIIHTETIRNPVCSLSEA